MSFTMSTVPARQELQLVSVLQVRQAMWAKYRCHRGDVNTLRAPGSEGLSVVKILHTQTCLIVPLKFLPARRYASAGNSDCNVSVRLSVRHAPVLCQNKES